MFLDIVKPNPETTVLDVGFSEYEYNESANLLEKEYPYPQSITALGIHKPKRFLERYPQVKAVKYDGKIFPFKDQSFDVCWSNAVLEHVGSRDKQLAFVKEIKRVAKLAFVTTPNRHFPVEVHTRTPLLHLLPKEIFDRYLSFVGKKWFTHLNLLSLKDIKKILTDSGISHYRVVKNRLLFFVLDFVIIFGNEQN